jgi:hypothetical protein
MSKWKFVRHNGEVFRQVGTMPDGSLYNPNGYPEDVVRSAVMAADAERHERRSQAAKEAAVTRRRRTARRVYAVGKRLTLHGDPIGPQNNCAICGRGLTDQVSIDRGIGSECWQDVLDQIALLSRPQQEQEPNVPQHG